MKKSPEPVSGSGSATRSHRQEVESELDFFRLWLAFVEQGARCDSLEREVDSMERSKSWRLTSPLRAIVRRVDRWRGRQAGRPALRDVLGAREVRPSLPASPPWLLAFLPPARDDRPRLLVDVTEISLEDLGAGVQRVTRRVLAELLAGSPSRYVVTPVRLAADGRYCVASVFLATFLGLPENAFGCDHLFDPRAGDQFLGLDFCRDRAADLSVGLFSLRSAGVTVTLTVPDVLPLTNPNWFPPSIAASYEQWLAVLATQSDRALCISADSAATLRRELLARGLALPTHGISEMRLGADLPPTPLPARNPLPVRAAGTTRVLMVGTIEPRKAHDQALEAFELLWSRDLPFELVIAGRRGWMVDTLLDRLTSHRELGRRLHWIDGPDDRVLSALYQECDVLLMASLGEGFGLPVAEAGRLGLGLVLRELPVFREVAGEDALYFSGDGGGVIAEALVAHRERPRHPRPAEDWATWASCAESIQELLALAGAAVGNGAPRSSDQETM